MSAKLLAQRPAGVTQSLPMVGAPKVREVSMAEPPGAHLYGTEAALLAALPEHHQDAKRLQALSGTVPGRYDRPAGCLFAPRCERAQALCHAEQAPVGDVRCFFPLTA